MTKSTYVRPFIVFGTENQHAYKSSSSCMVRKIIMFRIEKL